VSFYGPAAGVVLLAGSSQDAATLAVVSSPTPQSTILGTPVTSKDDVTLSADRREKNKKGQVHTKKKAEEEGKCSLLRTCCEPLLLSWQPE